MTVSPASVLRRCHNECYLQVMHDGVFCVNLSLGKYSCEVWYLHLYFLYFKNLFYIFVLFFRSSSFLFAVLLWPVQWAFVAFLVTWNKYDDDDDDTGGTERLQVRSQEERLWYPVGKEHLNAETKWEAEYQCRFGESMKIFQNCLTSLSASTSFILKSCMMDCWCQHQQEYREEQASTKPAEHL